MATTDPLTGARIDDMNDAPLGGYYLGKVVTDLRPYVTPQFASNSARDTAYAAFVAAGGVMADNMMCSVGGAPQVRSGGIWKGVASIDHGTNTVDTTLYTTNQTVMTLSIPDPGFAYTLRCAAQVMFGVVGAGVTAGARVRVNGTDLVVGNDAINLSGSTVNNLLSVVPTGVTGSLTGASTVTVFVSKSGTAGNGYQVTNSGGFALYNTLTALVVPA